MIPLVTGIGAALLLLGALVVARVAQVDRERRRLASERRFEIRKEHYMAGLTHEVTCKKSRNGWSYKVAALTPTGGVSDVIFETKQRYANTADMLAALQNAAAAITDGRARYTGLPKL